MMEVVKALILTIIMLNLVSESLFFTRDPLISHCTLRYRQSVMVPFIDNSAGALKIFAELTGKHLCRSLFLQNVTGARAGALFITN